MEARCWRSMQCTTPPARCTPATARSSAAAASSSTLPWVSWCCMKGVDRRWHHRCGGQAVAGQATHALAAARRRTGRLAPCIAGRTAPRQGQAVGRAPAAGPYDHACSTAAPCMDPHQPLAWIHTNHLTCSTRLAGQLPDLRQLGALRRRPGGRPHPSGEGAAGGGRPHDHLCQRERATRGAAWRCSPPTWIAVITPSACLSQASTSGPACPRLMSTA